MTLKFCRERYAYLNEYTCLWPEGDIQISYRSSQSVATTTSFTAAECRMTVRPLPDHPIHIQSDGHTKNGPKRHEFLARHPTLGPLTSVPAPRNDFLSEAMDLNADLLSKRGKGTEISPTRSNTNTDTHITQSSHPTFHRRWLSTFRFPLATRLPPSMKSAYLAVADLEEVTTTRSA